MLFSLRNVVMDLVGDGRTHYVIIAASGGGNGG
jgi:hypothetical protein